MSKWHARGASVAIGLLLLSGCAATQGAVQFARGVLDPGVPGPKPITAEAAAQLSDEQIAQRVELVNARLDDNRTHAAWWYYGFLTVNVAGMTAGAATAAVESDKSDQIYNILNSSLGLIGTGYMLAAPLPGRSGSDPITAMPSATHADRAAQLARAESILYDAAGRAKQRTGWILHAGNIALNASAASVLLARESYGNAALLFFLNATIGEAQILLTPWEPLTSWQQYHERIANGGIPVDPQARWGIGPLPAGPGLALQAEF
ncbi:MAG: hypothetical protein U0802_13875 [Candidatus Binatia bacterium]